MEHFTYILDEQGNPVPEPDMHKWSKWRGSNFDHVQVAEDFFGEIRVSTVFLAMVHPSTKLNDDTRPMLYETMVFADKVVLRKLLELSEQDDRSIISRVFGGTDIQKRYATRKEAETGHKNMCLFVSTCLTRGLLEEKEAEQ